MPEYSYECSDCGYEWDTYRTMADRAPGPCPECHSRNTAKIITVPQTIAPVDSGWESLNNGKGKWIGGLGNHKDPSTYCRSMGEATEKAKRRGLNFERA